jgi:glycosyltransferase involved in cell wall biosynthesis
MITDSVKQYSVKVSIVLPTFSQSHYLVEAIQAILLQTYSNFELIIVNDGFTDATAGMLAIIDHPKIKIITQENQGLPSALNSGFAVASGEYWTWTSTDNIVTAIWLEELVAALDNSPKEVAYAFSYYAAIDDSGHILFVNRDQRFDIATLLMRHTGNASFLYRSELAKNVGNYDTTLSHAEDVDMWIRMAEFTRAVQVESILYYYRLHSHSMTQQQQKIRAATKRVVIKYLAKTQGKFVVDAVFPSIQLSADPLLERWKARIWLATLGASATFYCPVDAIVDQLIQAMHENYDNGLLGNIVHLYAKEERWEAALQLVEQYREHDKADFLTQLADIATRQSKEDLQKKIPFLTLEEKLLAADCRGIWSQQQLQRNLAAHTPSPAQAEALSFEKIVVNLVNQLEDQYDHPEVWQNIATLQSAKEKTLLTKLLYYLQELIKIPQDANALLLLSTLEAVCIAYTGNGALAKNKLQQLLIQNPNVAVVVGALAHITQSEALV